MFNNKLLRNKQSEWFSSRDRAVAKEALLHGYPTTANHFRLLLLLTFQQDPPVQ